MTQPIQGTFTYGKVPKSPTHNNDNLHLAWELLRKAAIANHDGYTEPRLVLDAQSLVQQADAEFGRVKEDHADALAESTYLQELNHRAMIVLQALFGEEAIEIWMVLCQESADPGAAIEAARALAETKGMLA